MPFILEQEHAMSRLEATVGDVPRMSTFLGTGRNLENMGRKSFEFLTRQWTRWLAAVFRPII